MDETPHIPQYESSTNLENSLQNFGATEDVEKWMEIIQVVTLGINILYIAVFIATSYGLYMLSKKLGDKYPWLAFIPLVQMYTYIKTAGYNFWKGLLFLLLYCILGFVCMWVVIAIFSVLLSGVYLSWNLRLALVGSFFSGLVGGLTFVFVALFFLYSGMAKRAGQSTGTALLMTFFPWCMLYIVSKRIPDRWVKQISEKPFPTPQETNEL